MPLAGPGDFSRKVQMSGEGDRGRGPGPGKGIYKGDWGVAGLLNEVVPSIFPLEGRGL